MQKKKRLIFIAASMGCPGGLLAVQVLSQLQPPLVDLIGVAAPAALLLCLQSRGGGGVKNPHTQKQTNHTNERGRQALTNKSFYWKTNISDSSFVDP